MRINQVDYPKRIFAGSFSTVVPQVEPQSGHTYSYLSPSGRTSSRRFRTLTARRHCGHASRLASRRSKEGRRLGIAEK